MYLSLGQAAKETGKSKSVISNALKSGRLSGVRNGKGEWEIDPAELFRVFSPQNVQENGQKNDLERNSTPQNPLIELLKEQLQAAQDREQQARQREEEALERERGGREREARLLSLLEAEQHARRELEQKLLPAPPLQPDPPRRHHHLWILLMVLVAAIAALLWSRAGSWPI